MATITMSFSEEINTKGLYSVGFVKVSEDTVIQSQELEIKVNGVISPNPPEGEYLFLEPGNVIELSGSVTFEGSDPALSLNCNLPMLDE